MASGRVGGTRSKIRGQVGDIIYQVIKNPDGTFTQVEYGKPDTVLQTISPRGQAQRMCTSMVEALMRDLKPIGRISMESAANKSLSLNAFSSFNLRLVAQDCKAHWDGGGQFHYPPTDFVGTPWENVGGAWMLSSGTWQYNGFDAIEYHLSPVNLFPYVQYINAEFAGLKFTLLNTPETVDHFLRRHYLSVLDKMAFVVFRSFFVVDTETEDTNVHTAYEYTIVSLNPQVGSDTIVTEEVLNQLFQCDASFEVFKMCSDDGRAYYLGYMSDDDTDIARIQCYGGFTISYLSGKKKISSSRMKLVQENFDIYWYNYSPAEVFGTWMGTPSIKPYPYPFY